jgi:fatty-acyl-CoA synthase
MRLLTTLLKHWAIHRLSRAANLREIQRWMLHRYAQRTALVIGSRTLRFAALERQLRQWAQAIHAAGVGVGDRVLVAVDDPLTAVILRFACVEAGVVQMSFLPSHQIEFILSCARRGAPSLAIIDLDQHERWATQLRADLPDLVVWRFAPDGELEQRVLGMPPRAVAHEVPMDVPLSLGFTSGTTGQPKMMQLQQGQLLASMRLMLLNVDDVRGKEVSMLIAVPLNGAGGGVLMPVLLAGGTAIIPTDNDAQSLLTLLREYRPGRMFVTPSQLIDLLDAESACRSDFCSVSQLTYGSAPLPVARIREAIERFGPILQQGYGMSEALPPVAMLPPLAHVDDARDPANSALSSVGRIARGVRVEIRDEEGRKLAVGVIGRIWVNTPTLFSGYQDQPELNAGIFDATGFYFTGDMGYFDTQERLHVLDRIQDLIYRNDGVIYPRQIEERVHECEGVKEAVLVELAGVLHLVISPRRRPPAPVSQELIRRIDTHLQVALPESARPTRIHVWDELPRSVLGKVLRREVRAALHAQSVAA